MKEHHSSKKIKSRPISSIERTSQKIKNDKRTVSTKISKSSKKSVVVEQSVFVVDLNEQLETQDLENFRIFGADVSSETVEVIIERIEMGGLKRVVFERIRFGEDVSARKVIDLFSFLPREICGIDLRGSRFPAGFFIDFFGLLKEFELLNELILCDVVLDPVDVESLADWIRFEGCSLEHLDITRCSLDDKSIDTVKNAIINDSSLKHLYFGGNLIGDSAYTNVIEELFRENKNIQSLSVDSVRLNAYGSFRDIILQVKYYGTLTKLDLTNTGFNRECSGVFAKSLAEVCTITDLNLSKNYIYQETIDALETVFFSLRKLTLRGCFTKDGYNGDLHHFVSFIDLIMEKDSLESLDLENNLLNIDYILILTTYIKKTKNLLHINLSNNPLQLLGIRKLGASLTVNTSINSLSLRNIGMGDDGGTVLLTFLQWNDSINEIEFDGCDAPSTTIAMKITEELIERSTRREAQSFLAEKEDINEIVDLILQNNESNPRFQYMVPKESKRVKVIKSMINAAVSWAQKNGYCYVIKEKNPADENHTVIGCVVYLPAGVELKAPTGKFLKEAAKAFMQLGPSAVGRLKGFVKSLEDFSNDNCPDNGWKLLYYEVQEDLTEVDYIWKEVVRDIFNDANQQGSPVYTFITEPNQKPYLINVGFEEVVQGMINNEVEIWGYLRSPEEIE